MLRPRAIGAGLLVVPVLASVGGVADFHEPDSTDLSTTTSSIQAVQTVPVQMDPTVDVVEVPLPTAALSLSDTREDLKAAAQAREAAAAREAERASREASAARTTHTEDAPRLMAGRPTPNATKVKVAARESMAIEEPGPAPASSRGEAVIAAARTQIGDPYKCGGTGPASWDCSGLVQWAHRQAGVTLPRTAAMQQDATMRIKWSEAAPGDLLFVNDSATHVAIYLGGGMILQAPRSGLLVRVVSMGDRFDKVRRVR